MPAWEVDTLYQSPQQLQLPVGESATTVLVEVLTFPGGSFYWSGGSVTPLEVRPLYQVDGFLVTGEPPVYVRGPKSLIRFPACVGVKVCAKNDLMKVRVDVLISGSPLTIDGDLFTIDGVPVIV